MTNQRLYGFWEYGTFPYMTGGEISRIKEDGTAKWADTGYMCRPFLILPYQSGKDFHLALRALEGELYNKKKAIDREYLLNLIDIFRTKNISVPHHLKEKARNK